MRPAKLVGNHVTQAVTASPYAVRMQPRQPFPEDLRAFVTFTTWTFAKTYAATWPHEYVVLTPANAAMIHALVRHIVMHGSDGRFYSQIRKYHHEDGLVYWFMSPMPEGATLVNRCRED